MLHRTPRIARIAVGLSLLASLTVGSVMAQETVTQQITGGALTASITNYALGDVATSFAGGNSDGDMALSVSDLTGNGDGWNVTVESSDFVGAGNALNHDISNTEFSIGVPDAPASTGGQGTTDVTAGEGGSLDEARQVISAAAGSGMGSYTQNLPITLEVPSNAYTGLYTATLSVTESSGPGI